MVGLLLRVRATISGTNLALHLTVDQLQEQAVQAVQQHQLSVRHREIHLLGHQMKQGSVGQLGMQGLIAPRYS